VERWLALQQYDVTLHLTVSSPFQFIPCTQLIKIAIHSSTPNGASAIHLLLNVHLTTHSTCLASTSINSTAITAPGGQATAKLTRYIHDAPSVNHTLAVILAQLGHESVTVAIAVRGDDPSSPQFPPPTDPAGSINAVRCGSKACLPMGGAHAGCRWSTTGVSYQCIDICQLRSSSREHFKVDAHGVS
jgi:S-adenosylmethionine/arginine decarboxylase-like enzyme